ncbi:hypothetical protein ACI8AC_13380 [Geodermatophilus sp. SYSU D00758]
MTAHAPLPDLDRSILDAFRALADLRRRFDSAPCGEDALACEVAEARVNELLDLRWSLRRAPEAELAAPAA